MYGAAALADLVHDVPDIIAEHLVLPLHLVQRAQALRVTVPHAEQLGSGGAAVALGVLQLLREAVRLYLPVGHGLVELLESLLQLAVDNPRLSPPPHISNVWDKPWITTSFNKKNIPEASPRSI